MENLFIVLPKLLKGAVLTIQITSISVFCGIIIGLFMSLGKLSNKKILKILSSIYIDVIRGTPLFVQVLIAYFTIPKILTTITGSTFRVEAIVAGTIACSINSGAYVAEIFRAGIQSIEKGQMEAARSLGMTHGQAMKNIILPQAFRRIVPPLGNEFIVLLKDTSILAVIGVIELTQAGRLHVSSTFETFTFVEIAMVYLVMTFSISRFVAWLERRLGVSDSSK